MYSALARDASQSDISDGGTLSRAFGRDDDDAIPAAHAIQRRAGSVLEHLNGLDVMRIEPAQRAIRTRLDRDAVDHEQRLVAEHERRRTADADRDAAAGRLRHHHAGDATREQLLERQHGLAVGLFGQYGVS